MHFITTHKIEKDQITLFQPIYVRIYRKQITVIMVTIVPSLIIESSNFTFKNNTKRSSVLIIRTIYWTVIMEFFALLLTLKWIFWLNSFIIWNTMMISICSIFKLFGAPLILRNTTKPCVFMLIIGRITEDNLMSWHMNHFHAHTGKRQILSETIRMDVLTNSCVIFAMDGKNLNIILKIIK